jgi:HAND.
MAKTKTTTKKTTGMTREEQSKELFKNIREYNLLGFRIGDGLHNMFNTLVTSISKKKASVNPIYTYTVHGGTSLVVFNFGISVDRKKDSLYYVDVVVNKEKPGKTGLHLSTVPKAPKLPTVKDFQFSEQGIKDMLKEIKVIK